MKMRRPPKGEVWIHIDRFDRDDHRVWTVQHWRGDTPIYSCVTAFLLSGECYSQYFGPKAPQPKAVIVVPHGLVKLTNGKDRIASVYGKS